jgi:putative acetyltransferase
MMNDNTIKNLNPILSRITIRKGQLADLTEQQKLFVNAIETVCSADYYTSQLKTWASGIEDVKRWKEMLLNQFVLVAQREDEIVDFATLENRNYIDFFYVHKNYQRQGIGRKLYTEIEKEAGRQGQTELAADVSKTARPFFENMHFSVIKEQKIIRQGVELINFKMIKKPWNQ